MWTLPRPFLRRGRGSVRLGRIAGTIDLQSADPATLPGVQAGLDYGSRDAVSATVTQRSVGGSASLSGRYDRGTPRNLWVGGRLAR